MNSNVVLVVPPGVQISALLSGLPHKSPLIGCISLDCDFAAVSKVLKERRDQDKSLRYFVALQSCGKVFVELCIPQQVTLCSKVIVVIIKLLIIAIK